MNILFVSAEVTPFAKVGGLADVAGSLPKVIKELGHDIRVVLPKYGSIDDKKYKLKDVFNSEITLKFGDKEVPVSLKQGKIPNSEVIVYFIENNEYFGSHSEIYPKGAPSEFEHERYVIYGLASLELMKKIGFKPDIVHCNDWHSANIPVYLKNNYADSEFYSNTAVVFSIHNLAYQGVSSADILKFANMDSDKVFNADGLEFHGNINWMKGGIVYSDQINTVSKKYAEEIQTPEYGEGLDGLLRNSNYKLTGILNGIDYSVWNPATDPAIHENYSSDKMKGKDVCKKELQREYGLEQSDVPVLGFIHRLVDQKGLDLIAAISNQLVDMDLQFVLLGTGEEKYEILLKDLTMTSKNIKAVIGFNPALAQKIYAGCNFFIMPSKFEPCGLGQMIALKYGTIPIARKTGGLSDTIVDYTSEPESGNGFIFEEYNDKQFLDAVKRAVNTYNNSKEWNQLIKTAMNSDFSWNKSAKEYLEFYKKAKG